MGAQTIGNLIVFGIIVVGAVIAVPFLYEHRFEDRWAAISLIAFVGLPLLAGILEIQPSRFSTLVLIGLLLLCPIVYVLIDSMSAEFERIRDVLFLTTASMVIFVSAASTVNCVRSRQRTYMFVAALSLVCGIAAVSVIIWMFVYFE